MVLREHFLFFGALEFALVFSGASEFALEFASVSVILLQVIGSITTANNKRFIFQLSLFFLCYIVAGHRFDYTRK